MYENDPDIEYQMTYVKVVFMLRLAKMRNGSTSTQLALKKLLGTPMKFSVELFDTWWTIEHVPLHDSTEEVLELITLEELDLLNSTQHEEIYNRIKYTVEHKSMR